jgi:hypothetical protein
MLKDSKVVESNVNEKPHKFKFGKVLSNTLIFVLNHEFLMSHIFSPHATSLAGTPFLAQIGDLRCHSLHLTKPTVPPPNIEISELTLVVFSLPE